MNRDDIIRMAREADPFGEDGRLYSLALLTPETLERFAALVAAAEREAIADAVNNCDLRATPKGIAAAIRARGANG